MSPCLLWLTCELTASEGRKGDGGRGAGGEGAHQGLLSALGAKGIRYVGIMKGIPVNTSR